MNSLLSGVIAFIIALTSICGGIGNANVPQPVTVEAAITLDGDAAPVVTMLSSLSLPIPAEKAEKIVPLVTAVQNVLRAVSLRFVAKPDAGQLDVMANGNSLATVAVQANEAGDGWNAVSSLFPSTQLTVTNETLKSFTNSITASVPQVSGFSLDSLKELNLDAVVPVVTTAVGEVLAAFQASAGEPETGSFTVNDVEFTTKIPYNMTTKEAALLVLNKAKEVLSDENVAALLAKLPVKVSADSLDGTIEQITNSEPTANLDAATYINESGAHAMQILLLDENNTGITFCYMSAEGVVTIDLDMLGQLTVKLVSDSNAKKYSLSASMDMNGSKSILNGAVTVLSESEVKLEAAVSASGQMFGLNVTGTKGENQYSLSGSITYNLIPIFIDAALSGSEAGADLVFSLRLPTSDTAPLVLTFKGNVNFDNEPAFEVAEGANTVAFEALSQDQEAAAAFGQEVQASVMNLAQTFQQLFPDLFAAIADFQAPVEPAVVEEAPAEETVPAE